MYEKIRPNPSTVKIATTNGWKKVYGVRFNNSMFWPTGRIKTPCNAAMIACVIIISTPKIRVLVYGLAMGYFNEWNEFNILELLTIDNLNLLQFREIYFTI